MRPLRSSYSAITDPRRRGVPHPGITLIAKRRQKAEILGWKRLRWKRVEMMGWYVSCTSGPESVDPQLSLSEQGCYSFKTRPMETLYLFCFASLPLAPAFTAPRRSSTYISRIKAGIRSKNRQILICPFMAWWRTVPRSWERFGRLNCVKEMQLGH